MHRTDRELADFGDRAWDLGSVLQAFIADWVMAMPLDGSVYGKLGLPEHRFEQIQPTLARFWEAYRRRAGLPDGGGKRPIGAQHGADGL